LKDGALEAMPVGDFRMRLEETERKTLVASAFVATLMLMPLGGRLTSVRSIFRERIPALGALGVALLLLMWHVWRSRSDPAPAAAAGAATPAPLPPEDAPPPAAVAESAAVTAEPSPIAAETQPGEVETSTAPATDEAPGARD
jgi:hypothetical protein